MADANGTRRPHAHDDLRAPNFRVDGERRLLVDYDRGGREGAWAKYPDVQLYPIFFLKVSEHHDQIVLAITKENVCELVKRELAIHVLVVLFK